MEPKIIKAKEYKNFMPQVSRTLKSIVKSEYLESFDGGKLFCESYVKKENKKNMVIVHGYTEFTAKFHEQIWYFLNLGFNVFIYDQRGHGFSVREVDDMNLIHVEDFDCYVSDLEYVVKNIVNKYAPGLPLYMFSHSMGGAIVGLYVYKNPNSVKRAVFSSPMICPVTHSIPRPLVYLKSKSELKKNGKKAHFPYTGKFNPNVQFSDTLDGNRERFEYILEMRKAIPQYQAAGATNAWMVGAVSVQERLLDKNAAKCVRTKVLVLSAEKETVVKNKLQERFSNQFVNGRFESIKGAKHNIFSSSDEILKNYYDIMFSFLIAEES